MQKYRILLIGPSQTQLVKDDNATAVRPFDGGHVCYEPTSYPAVICSARYDHPKDGVYPNATDDWQEAIANTQEEWRDIRARYIRDGRV